MPSQYRNGLALFPWFSSTYRNWKRSGFILTCSGLGHHTATFRQFRHSKNTTLVDHSLHTSLRNLYEFVCFVRARTVSTSADGLNGLVAYWFAPSFSAHSQAYAEV